jgi:hypothetical protein
MLLPIGSVTHRIGRLSHRLDSGAGCFPPHIASAIVHEPAFPRAGAFAFAKSFSNSFNHLAHRKPLCEWAYSTLLRLRRQQTEA